MWNLVPKAAGAGLSPLGFAALPNWRDPNGIMSQERHSPIHDCWGGFNIAIQSQLREYMS